MAKQTEIDDLHGLTADELIILERLSCLNYLDNFDPSDHSTIDKIRNLGLLDERYNLPALSTNEIGARTIYYKRALDIRRERSCFDVIQCRFKDHDWWGDGIAPWKKDLARTPTAGYCKRCGAYVEYIGNRFDWRNSGFPRDEDGNIIRLYSDYDEWIWK